MQRDPGQGGRERGRRQGKRIETEGLRQGWGQKRGQEDVEKGMAGE